MTILRGPTAGQESQCLRFGHVSDEWARGKLTDRQPKMPVRVRSLVTKRVEQTCAFRWQRLFRSRPVPADPPESLAGSDALDLDGSLDSFNFEIDPDVRADETTRPSDEKVRRLCHAWQTAKVYYHSVPGRIIVTVEIATPTPNGGIYSGAYTINRALSTHVLRM